MAQIGFEPVQHNISDLQLMQSLQQYGMVYSSKCCI